MIGLQNVVRKFPYSWVLLNYGSADRGTSGTHIYIYIYIYFFFFLYMKSNEISIKFALGYKEEKYVLIVHDVQLGEQSAVIYPAC